MTHRHRLALLAVLAAGAAIVAAPVPAGAHVGPSVGGLGDGLAHPVTGLDHVLAMVAVGVVAAVAFERGRRWVAPVAFAGAMALGGIFGLVSVPVPGAELVIVWSVLTLGIAIAVAVELRSAAGATAMGLLAVAGFAHGHAHGMEAPAAASPVLYVAGFVIATGALHLAGVAIGAMVRDREAMRVGVGAFVAAAGALVALG
jgi:urease accessory protein